MNKPLQLVGASLVAGSLALGVPAVALACPGNSGSSKSADHGKKPRPSKPSTPNQGGTSTGGSIGNTPGG